MTGALDALAAGYGIAVAYKGLDGVTHAVPDGTKIAILRAMGVDADSDAAVARSLELAPEPNSVFHQSGAQCFIPEWLHDGRGWGISVQVYGLRSMRNWGIGDFADLAAISETLAHAGADFVGVNPLHAGFIADPERRSPFFPSSRQFLNPLYIAPDMVPGFEPVMVDQSELSAARAGEFVDYSAVTKAKLAALRRLWPVWRGAADLPAAYARDALATYKAAGGTALRLHGLFEALSLEMVRAGHGAGWEAWPSGFAAPDEAGAQHFAADDAEEIDFHVWLQWLASVQLAEAKKAALANGMRIGLYLDLAVGEAPDGSATWSDAALAMRGVHIGAPPDYFSESGQDWQLAPLSPATLLERNLLPYRHMISASMHYGGALRIDHAMSIRQLFLIPRGRSPVEGTYVHYPTAGILDALASASHEHRTLVVGEDLGNVPEGFRDLMAQARMLSYRILYFERYDNGFIAAEHYPRDALACLSTHDLPTFEGWWLADDVDLRRRHDLIDEQAAQTQQHQRAVEREQLAGLLVGSGLLSPAVAEAALDAVVHSGEGMPGELVVAVHRFLARSPARLLAVRLEDLVGQRDPVNLPGTIDTYPNWKRRLPLRIDEIAASTTFRNVTEALKKERPNT